MAGYPDQYSVASRNRHGSNQPGSLSDPHSKYDFDTLPNQETKMSMMASQLRQDVTPEPEMDYTEANVPDHDDTPTWSDIEGTG